MRWGIVFIGVLSLICCVIQLLAVISVPITGQGTGYTLALSHYNNVSFGVFGVCDTVRDTCSSPKIGYSSADSFTYLSDQSEALDSLTVVQLPSEVTHFISKLLVVHVIAFVFTSLLVLQTGTVLLLDVLDGMNIKRGVLGKLRRVLHCSGPSGTGKEPDLPRPHYKRKQSYVYYNFMLLFAIMAFLLTLLAFLADILLFVPKMTVLGWIQLLPILFSALIASFVCFLKRSIQSRRHLDDEVAFGHRHKNTGHSPWEDDGSEERVVIYSNGFLRDDDTEEDEHIIIANGHDFSILGHSDAIEMRSLTDAPERNVRND